MYFFAIKERLWVLGLFLNVFEVMSFDFFSTMIKCDNKRSVRRYIFHLVEDGRYKIVIMNLAKTGNQSTSVHVWHVQSELSLHLSQGDKNFLLELTCL